jgi:hypothetical protein
MKIDLLKRATSIGQQLEFFKFLQEDLTFKDVSDVSKIVIYYDAPEKSIIIVPDEGGPNSSPGCQIESGQTGNAAGFTENFHEIKLRDRITRLLKGVHLLFEEEIARLEEEAEEL